jgi:protoheme IX farnesyltransferase
MHAAVHHGRDVPSLARDLIAITKPRVTLMVLVTTAGGLWLAPGPRAPLAVIATLLGTALVVSSANALNCWMERDVDRRMTRTRRRPLPAGRLDPQVALVFGLALGALAVPLLSLLVNALTGLLAAIALVTYVWIYTPLKQVSPAALFVGAIPGAIPPLMGWTAATGALEAPGIVLFGILFVWQLPHFLAIAMFRRDEYVRAGIRVLPAVYGDRMARWHTAMWAGALVPVTLLLVPLGIAGTIYLVVAGISGVLFATLCVFGLRRSFSDEARDRWPRAVFVASLAYLPLLFAALAIDVAAR